MFGEFISAAIFLDGALLQKNEKLRILRFSDFLVVFDASQKVFDFVSP